MEIDVSPTDPDALLSLLQGIREDVTVHLAGTLEEILQRPLLDGTFNLAQGSRDGRDQTARHESHTRLEAVWGRGLDRLCCCSISSWT